ncbi:hypothetical protein ABK040_005796 [Willaertia magna]
MEQESDNSIVKKNFNFTEALIQTRKIIDNMIETGDANFEDKSAPEKSLIKFVHGNGEVFKAKLVSTFKLNKNTASHYQAFSFWSRRCWKRLIKLSKTPHPRMNRKLLTSLSYLVTKISSCKGLTEEEIYFGLDLYLKYRNVEKMAEYIKSCKKRLEESEEDSEDDEDNEDEPQRKKIKEIEL